MGIAGILATLTADAFNLDSDGSCGDATTKTQAQINLGPLAPNGGSTQTMALERGQRGDQHRHGFGIGTEYTVAVPALLMLIVVVAG